MRSFNELLETNDPAMALIRQWVSEAKNPVEILEPADQRGEVLHTLQVSTHSTLGAIAYETGGILVDHGWVRFLGSGHPRIGRDLVDWNRGRTAGYFLFADDAVGGFFALNGGALGANLKGVYYWPSDSLDWQDLELGYTDFFQVALTERLAEFYSGLRWPTWKQDVKELPGDRCFNFYPFLWTMEGSVTSSNRRPIPVAESFDLKVDIVRQLTITK